MIDSFFKAMSYNEDKENAAGASSGISQRSTETDGRRQQASDSTSTSTGCQTTLINCG